MGYLCFCRTKRVPRLQDELESLLITLYGAPSGNRNTPHIIKKDMQTENTIREVINVTKKYMIKDGTVNKQRIYNHKPRRALKLNMDWKRAPVAVLKILGSSRKPLGRKDIVKIVKNRYKFTTDDLEILQNGNPRWDNTVRWAISGLKSKHMISSKNRNEWIITKEGRISLQSS